MANQNILSPKALNTLWKVVVWLLVAILAIWAILKVKNLLFTEIQNQKLVSDANAEIDTTLVTLTTTQFNTLSSKLYMAVKGAGTDEDAVYDVFNTLNTRSDLLQLQKIFGVKDNMTLEEWIYDDLSQSEIDKVNSILASKSINYTF